MSADLEHLDPDTSAVKTRTSVNTQSQTTLGKAPHKYLCNTPLS
jgi:hypothetical protein